MRYIMVYHSLLRKRDEIREDTSKTETYTAFQKNILGLKGYKGYVLNISVLIGE